MSIVQEPAPVLRRIATAVPAHTITSVKIRAIIKSMKDALNGEDDGVAIAAPQIGESLRIFVVSYKASKQFTRDMTFINPSFVRVGKQKEDMSEGCLSCRWKYGITKRATTATIRALNEDGNEFVVSGRGLLAQIFQHEMDHLDGVLFVDKARDIKDIPPENHAND